MNTLNVNPDQDWNGIFDERNSTCWIRTTGIVLNVKKKAPLNKHTNELHDTSISWDIIFHLSENCLVVLNQKFHNHAWTRWMWTLIKTGMEYLTKEILQNCCCKTTSLTRMEIKHCDTKSNVKDHFCRNRKFRFFFAGRMPPEECVNLSIYCSCVI
jgi:hypothetical protein